MRVAVPPCQKQEVNHAVHDQECEQCRGSGACDPCDGYGFYPDTEPGAGDGPECEFCTGSGECPTCHTAQPAMPTAMTTHTEDVT